MKPDPAKEIPIKLAFGLCFCYTGAHTHTCTLRWRLFSRSILALFIRKTMCRKSGFSLIELLVVIAIIALLLSIITPSLKLAKEKANNLFCRANVRSLSLGFRLYTETNDGKVFGYGSSGGNNLWLMQISDQLGDTNKVRYCPSTKLNETPPPPGAAPTKPGFGLRALLNRSTALTE